jgi:hypothetical protein
VVHWAASSRNAERRCVNINTASCWLARDISVERANSDGCDCVKRYALKKSTGARKGYGAFFITSHLKKIFWPNIFVGSRFQILNIQAYASGLKPGSAVILNQNPFFEMACGEMKLFGKAITFKIL